jgi:hypothetical protein
MHFAPSLHGYAESLVYRQIVFDLGGFVADLLIWLGAAASRPLRTRR